MDQRLYTAEDIIGHATSLRPVVAARTGGNPAECRTPIYTRLIDQQGQTHELQLVNHKYAVIYIRVSTARQTVRRKGGKRAPNALEQADGLSPRDQIINGLRECIKHRWAFAIISDVGIHGDLSHNDKTEITKQRRRRAELYERVYRQVVMARRPYTPEEERRMQDYLATKLQIIRTRGLEVASEEESATYRQRASNAVNFRAGLTTLLQSISNIHSVLVTDLSRLSRSDSLTADLLELFADPDHRVRLVGTVEDLSQLNDRDGVGTLYGHIQGWFASQKLAEVLRGVIRGQLTLLEQGYAHGKLPSWCIRDDQGRAQLNPEVTPIIRELVRLYVEGRPDGRPASYRWVASELGKQGLRAPQGQWWTEATVKAILQGPHLRGYQESYGLLWPTLPALIDEETARRIEEVQRKPAEEKRVYECKGEAYLLQGLIRCQCGRTCLHMDYNHTNTHKGIPAYACRARAGETRNGEGAHFRLRSVEMDRFINQLMTEHFARFWSLLDQHDTGKRLVEELKAWEAEAERRRAERAQAEQEAIPLAEERAAQVADPSDRDWEEWLRRALQKLTRTQQERVQEAEQQVARLKRALAEAVPEASLQDQAARWDQLNGTERNKLLRSIFREFRYKDETLVPVLLHGQELPPIHFEVEVREGKQRRQVVRSMPNPLQWFVNGMLLNPDGKPRFNGRGELVEWLRGGGLEEMERRAEAGDPEARLLVAAKFAMFPSLEELYQPES